jgi:hypothetical protein
MPVSAGSQDPRRPLSSDPVFPRVIHQEHDGNRGVLVTFALPGLRRAVVRVPFEAWANGEHLAVGRHLADRPPWLYG